MSCTKEISGFCSRFLSLNLSMSGSSGPTLEVSILGEPFDWTEIKNDPKSVAGSIVEMLNQSNFPISGEWMIVKIEAKKSSSGVVTNVQMIDKQWAIWNNYQIGLTLNSGGDVVLGEEYFNVTGIPWGDIVNAFPASAPRNILVRGGLYRSLYHELNIGNIFINNYGGWSQRPSNITQKDFIEKHVPGLTNPWTEFGQYYYNFKKEIVGHAGGVFSNIPFPGDIEGLFNESGSAYDVFSSIGARFGYVFVPTTNFLGFHRLTSDFGKLNVLTSAGISIPDDAESSSYGVDYGAGYSQESFLHVKSPGREMKEATQVLSDDNQNLAEVEPKRIKERESSLSISNDNLWEQGFTAGITDKHIIWRFIKESPLIQELGQAYYIYINSTLADDAGAWKAMYPIFASTGPSGTRDIVDEDNSSSIQNPSEAIDYNHRVMYGFASKLNAPEANPFKNAARALGFEDVYGDFEGDVAQGVVRIPNIEDKIDAYLRNYNRFSYIDDWNTDDITEQGDIANSWYPSTFGFRNFGTKFQQLGTKEYYAENKGDIEFIIGETPIENTQMYDTGINNNIITIDDVVGRLNPNIEQGVILISKKANEFPQIDMEINYEGFQNLIDIEPSVRTQVSVVNPGGGTPDKEVNLLGGVAAINYGGLQKIAKDFVQGIQNKLTNFRSNISKQSTTVWMTGLKEPMTVYNNNLTSSSAPTSPAQVNQTTAVNRQAWSTQCGDKPNWDISLVINRKIFNFNVDYAIHERPSLKEQSGQIESPDSGAVWYLDEQGVVQKNAYMDSCNYSINVPYLEKISFTLVNQLYTHDLKYLESANISVVGGKLTANYTFSQKVMAPDYAGLSGAKASLQNLLH